MKPWHFTGELPEVIPVDVPDGISGDWSVSTFTVSEEAERFGAMRAAFSSAGGRYVPAGTYAALKRGGTMVMSNTPDEIRDQFPFFRAAEGTVLINGLGLGITLDVVLNKIDERGEPFVKRAFVVEKSADVLSLVKPVFEKDSRVHFINADALEYKPEGLSFDAVWHDIWDNICADNLPQMHKLHRKYARRSKWQASWCRKRCEYQKRREELYR
jgi:hypothetical protein